MEILDIGQFGEQILPIGFRAPLEYAARNRILHVVPRINSPGGYLWAVLQLVKDMKASREQLEFHALIERTVLASIWPTFICKTITLSGEGGQRGALRHGSGRASGSTDRRRCAHGRAAPHPAQRPVTQAAVAAPAKNVFRRCWTRCAGDGTGIRLAAVTLKTRLPARFIFPNARQPRFFGVAVVIRMSARPVGSRRCLIRRARG
ncbi:MAG: hypothetical protein DYG94_11275 [Leptolyngbya sp. PLA3]|nr:MAG: hypothetical protein EDM82_10765 [Cyanobacteria bacterium CYA]MCE7969310.1 hypothetical protein [Leptolyngbya sp. PL-A3]